jgi:SAM-dependent methyltransferase
MKTVLRWLLHLYHPIRIVLTRPNNHEFVQVGTVRFGHLRRLTPLSRAWGFDRGLPIDRNYIESFLALESEHVRGRVLEVGDNAYTRKFGADRVGTSDVLHVNAGAPHATITGDLTRADHIASNSFDCIILTQTLQLIYDTRAAIKTLHRILAPRGVLLVTVPGITPIGDQEWMRHWYWNFTARSAQRAFGEQFGTEAVSVAAYGNVLTAIGFLHGLAAEELTEEEKAYRDENYEVVITIKAEKVSSR